MTIYKVPKFSGLSILLYFYSYLCRMRMKRTILLTLMTLANILLLVHVVMPHSHHDGIVCFSLSEINHHSHCTTHQHDDIGACCAEHCEHNEHHNHQNSEDCDLKDIVLRSDSDTHQDLIPCPNCLSLQYIIYTLNDLYLEEPQFGQWLVEKPYLENYTPPFVGTIKSLRAPPVSYFLG